MTHMTDAQAGHKQKMQNFIVEKYFVAMLD